MVRKVAVTMLLSVIVLVPGVGSAQSNAGNAGYLVSMGDSVAAGEGALPVTGGYAYNLYHFAVFGPVRDMDFANMAVRGARSWELRDHQVPQVLCAEPTPRPTVVTITAGANDFLRGDQDILSIARRVADAVNLLLNNDNGLVAMPVLDPITSAPCRALGNVTILVSNYYSIPHPDPLVAATLDAALVGFDQALRFWLQRVPVPAGSKVALVDLYTPSLGRRGLVIGGDGANFDVHPTNLGHLFISRQFKDAWDGLD